MPSRPNLKLGWTDVDSSNVHSVTYDRPTKTLAVRFIGGALYSYMEAPEEYYVGMLAAESVGRYLNNVVKAQLPYTRWENEQELIEHLSL